MGDVQTGFFEHTFSPTVGKEERHFCSDVERNTGFHNHADRNNSNWEQGFLLSTGPQEREWRKAVRLSVDCPTHTQSQPC